MGSIAAEKAREYLSGPRQQLLGERESKALFLTPHVNGARLRAVYDTAHPRGDDVRGRGGRMGRAARKRAGGT